MTWNTLPVVELTDLLSPAPLMVARRRKVQDAQSTSERERVLGAVDCPEQPALRGSFRQPGAVEPNIECSQECDEQSDNCAQYSDTASEGKNFGLQPGMVHVREIRRDDGSVVATQPTQGGRARNAELGDDFGIAYGSHEVPKTMVVGPLGSDRIGEEVITRS